MNSDCFGGPDDCSPDYMAHLEEVMTTVDLIQKIVAGLPDGDAPAFKEVMVEVVSREPEGNCATHRKVVRLARVRPAHVTGDGLLHLVVEEADLKAAKSEPIT